MDDPTIFQRIGQLTDEEDHLYQRSQAGEGVGLDLEDSDRLRSIEVALDQCWDLLRQRRARRSAGLDPGDAEVRPAAVVEGYRQ